MVKPPKILVKGKKIGEMKVEEEVGGERNKKWARGYACKLLEEGQLFACDYNAIDSCLSPVGSAEHPSPSPISHSCRWQYPTEVSASREIPFGKTIYEGLTPFRSSTERVVSPRTQLFQG